MIGGAGAVSPVSAVTLPALSGFARYETFGYPDPDADSPSWENFFEVVMRLNGRLTDRISYRCEGRAVADDVGFTVGAYEPRNAGYHRPYLSLITGVVDYRPTDGVRVAVGKQIINWSSFDSVQPANLMTPFDESDVFRRIEIGVPSVTLHVEREVVYGDLAVIPLAMSPSRIPQGRWNIIPDGGVEEIQALPPVRVDETQAGVRLGAQAGALDLSLIGYVGRDFSAVFVPELVYVGGPERFQVQIIDRYPRTRAGGISASHPVGDSALLRTESMYFSSPDDFQDNFFLSAVGLEYTWRDWRLNLNYLRNDRVDSAPEEPTDRGERQFFESFVFGELRYDAGGTWRGYLRGGYDIEKEFALLEPELVVRVWRDLEVALTGNIINGQGDTYFARIQHEDRVGTRLTYYY